MNLRILKKLSKRAAPYLPLLGDNREQFTAGPGKGDCYIGVLIKARKNFERCPSVHDHTHRQGEICIAPRCRQGSRFPFVKAYPPDHPLEGTPMIGGMSGYETPEWDEDCTYGVLCELVHWSFVDFKDGDLVPTRKIRTPRDVFAAADELVAQQRTLR